MTDTVQSLPILDISRFDRSGSHRAAFLKEVRAAARGPGFFYLTGHGIPPEQIRELRALAKRFFALPEADKLAIAMVNSPHFRGYNRAGLEYTRGQPDWREQIDIGPEKQQARLGPDAPGLGAVAGAEPVAGLAAGAEAGGARLSGRSDQARHQGAAHLRGGARPARGRVRADLHA